jgi:carbon monoxide dehydrogenase subunit G
MSSIDIAAETDINAAPADIAAVMFDPEREKDWVGVVSSVEIHDAALQPGARVTHRGSVMGREVALTTEVETVHFPHVLALRVSEPQFSGLVRFEIARAGSGSRVRIRAEGESDRVNMLTKMMVEGAVQSGVNGALSRLKGIVEG